MDVKTLRSWTKLRLFKLTLVLADIVEDVRLEVVANEGKVGVAAIEGLVSC